MNGPPQKAGEVAPDVAPTGADEEIYCPICNYNLTGIATGRCPECGSLFDREALMANQKANRITLIPWDDPAETEFWPRFKKTLKICLFDSKRFAFAFSVQPQETRASSFLGIVSFGSCFFWFLVLLGLAFVGSFVGHWDRNLGKNVDELIIMGFSMVLAWLAMILASTYFAAIILGICCPHFDGKRHFKPWWSISAYSSAHYLLAPIGLPIATFLLLWSEQLIAAGFLFGFLMVGLACGLLCACTLIAVAKHRGAATGGRSLAILALWLIYLVTPIVVPIAMGTIAFGLIQFLRL